MVEAETDGGAVAAPTIHAGRDRPALASRVTIRMEFTPRPWITAIVPRWAVMENGQGARRGSRPGFGAAFAPADPEPLPALREGSNSRIFAFVDDLFFAAKIQETARKLNVKVEFAKDDKDLAERMLQNGEEKPSLIIFDLNNANAKPLTLIPKLKSKLKKGTSIIGFLSHVQGDLKQKAHEVGCDMVLPRSAFSQNLPQLLRRHGAPEEENPTVQ